MTPPMPAKVDAETLCTRVVARVIEGLGCIEIAPDSPESLPLSRGETRLGELRVFRGRRGVARIVTSKIQLATPALDSHMTVVLTPPGSPVPHLVVDSVVAAGRASFHVDLLPRVDPTLHVRYMDLCYEPLSALCDELDKDARFAPGTVSRRQRATLSAWMRLFTFAPDDFPAALGYVDRIFEHWASLACGEVGEQLRAIATPDELRARDAQYRRVVFSREVDPVWGMLERALGPSNVDTLLSQLVS